MHASHCQSLEAEAPPARAGSSLDGALRTRGPALRSLVAALTPVIEARVARALLLAERSDLEHELPDLVQELLLMLFKDDARLLRRWTPELGVSLADWVGLICERRLRELVQRMRSRGTASRLAAPTALALAHDPGPSLEARYELAHLLRMLRRAMSARAVALFETLWLHEEDVATVARRFTMSQGAVYAARARVLRVAREVSSLD